MYFSTYQAIAKDERRPGLYRDFPPDFFDLIIADECHRDSARDESNCREILEYFETAFQLGMTATPLREDDRDTYAYIGNPTCTYSLRQGIDDGFLAPYRVHRIITTADAHEDIICGRIGPRCLRFSLQGKAAKLTVQRKLFSIKAEVHVGWCSPRTSNPVGLPMVGRSVRFRHTSAKILSEVVSG